MPPSLSETNKGISSTTEWYLLNTLRNATDRIRPPRRNDRGNISELPPSSAGSLLLWNAARELNTQIRTTFTTLKFDVLLHWESEVCCREADDDSESDSGTDTDDLPRLLERLCGLLESRANISAFQDPTSLNATSPKYPNFGNLIEYIQSPSPADLIFDFIPNPKSGETSYLFDIASDVEVAAAFAALRDPTQRWPRKDMRRRMIEEIGIMKGCLSDVNDVVNRLRRSITSLTARPTANAPSSTSFTSFNGLRSFRDQMYAACQAIISQFGACKYPTHKAILQLPGWEDTSHSPEGRRKLRLFINICSKSIWQPVNVCFLERKAAATATGNTLCKYLEDAYKDDRDFNFCVSKDSRDNIHIPDQDRSELRKEDPALPNDNASLWDQIVDGWFAKRPPMDLLIKTRLTKIELGIEQRRRLCVKLVLGLMLSMDNDYPIDTWNPTSIFFVGDVIKNDWTPCIFIRQIENDASQREHSIRKLLAITEHSESSMDPELLGIFIAMAKTLLGIAEGERLEMIRATGARPEELQQSKNTLRRTIAIRIHDAVGKEPDLETLPFLHAAERCLEFESQYNKLRDKEKSIASIETAWQLIFKDILTTLDSNLNLPLEEPAKLLFQTTDNYTNSMRLFDGETGDQLAIERAAHFFGELDMFHQAFVGCTEARSNDSTDPSQRRVRIAILDTGIDFRCPAVRSAKMRQRIRAEWCRSWIGEDTDYKDEDDSLHGTNCVHLLHKSAPEADIYVAKVFSGSRFNESEAENVAKAIDHAVKTWNVDIISMSFGINSARLLPVFTLGKDEETTDRNSRLRRNIEEAMRKALAKSCVLFAAASNAGKNQSRAFPASSRSGVICIHASDGLGNDGGINPAADSGDNFMTLGMGHELQHRKEQKEGKVSRPTWKTVHKSGTSFATPVAAGIAATILDLARRIPQVNEWTREDIHRHECMRKVLEDISGHGSRAQYPYRYIAPWKIWAEQRRAGDTNSEVFASWINGVLGN